MKAAGRFSMITGAGMLGLWTMLLIGGRVPELETEPATIIFHLTAESLTGLALIAAGSAVLLGRRQAAWFPVALGMLIYAVVNSMGYYVHRGGWAMVAVFAIILIMALACLLGFIREAGRAGAAGQENN